MKPPIHIAPRWTILEPGQTADRGTSIVLGPGAGWGDGTHPTTRLCLQALSALAPRQPGKAWRMLDFGSGSGILSIGAALLGADVEAVEIDEKAIEHGRKNISFNAIADRVHISNTLDSVAGSFDLVMANILSQVLLDHAGQLVDRLAPGGILVLSGLVATDVPPVSVRYRALLHERRPEIYEKDEWRALVWRLCSRR